MRDIFKEIILLSARIFKDSFKWCDNGDIKVIPQFITLNKGPKSVSRISDAPVRSKCVKFAEFNLI